MVLKLEFLDQRWALLGSRSKIAGHKTCERGFRVAKFGVLCWLLGLGQIGRDSGLRCV